MFRFVAGLAVGTVVAYFLPRKPLINALHALGAKLQVEGALMQDKLPRDFD